MTAKKKRSTKALPTTAQKASAPHTRAAQASVPASAAPQDKKLSALDAAARLLRETGQAMSCPELIEQMTAKGYWSSPQGKTPSATLYAAIAREIQLKGEAARFVKTGPGRFAYRGTDA
jgi:hypothetical protein